jgi:hypothetical protein
MLAPAVLLLWLALAQAQVYVNGVLVGSTSSATPKAVGTAVPVLLFAPVTDRRCSITMSWLEAGNLSCLPVGTGAVNAGTVPSATNGFVFAAGRTWITDGLTGDPRLGWQCVSTTGTVNVSTEEVYHCANTKTGM